MKLEVEKLLNAYKNHGKIIVGCDFDDTIFPYTNNKMIEDRCEKVIELLKEVGDRIILCLYSADTEHTLRYKVAIMRLKGIDPHCVNDSPVKPHGNTSKPYFNLLLDDKAGLNEAIEILTEFINYTNQ